MPGGRGSFPPPAPSEPIGAVVGAGLERGARRLATPRPLDSKEASLT